MPTPTRYTLRMATPQKRAAIVALLQAVNLPTEDLPQTLDTFLIAEVAGEVVGSVGLELHGDHALLRSLAVTPQQRGTGMGKALYDAALALAFQKGVREVYLLTTTATSFFEEQGYATIDRTSIPMVIGRSSQFTGVCPSSATIMHRKIQ